jgi:hypothetical protein
LDAMPAWKAVERFDLPLIASPLAFPAYDMAQRYRRDARPFGSADADARARRQTGANWGRPDPRGRQHGRIGR